VSTKLRVIVRKGTKTGAYIGYEALAKILAATKQPVTALQVSEACGITHMRAKSLMHQFRVLGLVHRVGFVKPSHGYSSPVYLIGEGENVPAPLLPDGRPQPHADHRPAIQPRVLTFASIIKCMQGSPVTANFVIEQSHAGAANCRRAIHALRSVGLCCVADYVHRDGTAGPLVALYEYAVDGKDAIRPQVQKVRRRDETRRVMKPAWSSMIAQLAPRRARRAEAVA
jgi:hypothetical protein